MITTRTEDKNKNNFKMIMENFRKAFLSEQVPGGTSVPGPMGAYARARDLAKKGSKKRELTPQVRRRLRADAAKLAKSGNWKIKLLRIPQYKKWFDAAAKEQGHDPNSKDGIKNTFKYINRGGFGGWSTQFGIERVWGVYSKEVLQDEEVWVKILERIYPYYNESFVKQNHVKTIIKQKLQTAANEKEGKNDVLDHFDGFAASGDKQEQANAIIAYAVYYGELFVKGYMEKYSDSAAAASTGAQQDDFVGPQQAGLDQAAQLLGMSSEDLQSALATPEGQSTILSQLQNNNASQEIVSAVQQYIDYVQSNSAAASQGAGGSSGVTTGPNQAPAPAGAPNWLKRKANKQAELIRRLNQGVTGLQEQNLGVGGLKIDKEFQDNTDSASPATSANTASAAAPVPGTEKQSVTLKMLQQSLINMGYNLGPRGADGEYGPATYKAIRKFQADNKLQKDGLIGPNTFSHMRGKDKKLMSQSATMGMDLPKEIEKTVDKIAKAPRGKKSKAYIQGVLSSPKDIKKLKDKARSVRKDAIDKLKQAKQAGDVGEMNRQQRRIQKATGVYRSASAGEDEARKLKSTEKLRKAAIDAGYLYMFETEWPKNAEIYRSWEPALQDYFRKMFGVDDSKVGSTNIKKGKLGRLLQIYRTGRNSKNKPALKLQKRMKRVVRIFNEEFNKPRKDT